METKIISRCLVLPLLAATILFAVSPLLAQPQRQIATEPLAAGVVAPTNSCPAPMDLTLRTTSLNVFKGDFVAGQLAGSVGFNYGGTDKHFLYTFQWKPAHRCCQITKAVLTVNMQANQGGQSAHSSDAGNDAISIMHLGTVVAPYSEAVYSHWPFQAGQQVTKVWNLQGAALANVNADNRLSFYVEDDTMVKSATLQLIGCCLLNSTPTPLDYATKADCERVEVGRTCVQISNGTWHAE
ncbi:MAG TPA: hypothetical protein VFE33_09265 [Thermoanaerobaculia bacterium]|nr:hypothetical protein [Thermoanaerobaculia bacterium]